jgi:O-antigen/teichoic acid export membrane protein
LESKKLSKARKIFMNYMMVMQLIFTVGGLGIFGFYLGNRLNPDSDLNIYLTAAGLFIGVFVGFVTLYQFMKSEERYERRTRN